jgi:hypothetical protein
MQFCQPIDFTLIPKYVQESDFLAFLYRGEHVQTVHYIIVHFMALGILGHRERNNIDMDKEMFVKDGLLREK